MWDLPTRLFHWALVISVAVAYFSGKEGRMDIHFYAGYSVLALLTFRLLWGGVGAYTARFSYFIPTPKKLISYLRAPAAWQGQGHNPLGALSVVAIILLLLLQTLLGLFANDEVTAYGPWSHWIENAENLTRLHKAIGEVLLPLWFLLHIAAIIWYRTRGKKLLPPMIHGGTAQPMVQDNVVTRLIAALLLCVAIMVVWYLVAVLPT